MIETKKIVNKSINQEKLVEELASGLGVDFFRSIGFAGFEFSAEEILAPFSERRKVGERRDSDGQFFEDFADPGELRFGTDQPLTPTQNNTLDQVLANHDSAIRTVEQKREDKDEAAFSSVENRFKRGVWDNLPDPQRIELLRRVAQLFLRSSRDADLDTDD